MTALGKWIDGLTSASRVSDAARLSLEARLAAVTYWLPLAARQLDDDAEKVHQLRVSTRRAIAALVLYRDWLPRRRADRLTKRLKKIRRAAGDARDLDVLSERLGREFGDRAEELQSVVADRRAAVQPKIEEVAEKCLRTNRLQKKVSKLLNRIRPRDEEAKQYDESFGKWATVELRRVAEEFFAKMPEGMDDLKALHRFRIACKRLRYTMELLSPAFGRELRDESYPVVERLQELLGRINDCVTGKEYLATWSRELESPEHRELVQQLIEREENQLREAIDDCRGWWTAERANALRQALGLPVPEAEPPQDAPLDHSFAG